MVWKSMCDELKQIVYAVTQICKVIYIHKSQTECTYCIFCVNLDQLSDICFLFQVSRGLFSYILDCLFTVCIIHSLIVSFWRGLWSLYDLLFFPDDLFHSALYGLILGYVLTISGWILQYPVNTTLKGFRKLQYPKILEIIVEDGYSFILNSAAVTTWRGIWNLMALKAWPQFTPIRLWMFQLGSLGMLMLLCCGKSVLVTGCQLDGRTSSEGVGLQVQYIRQLLKWKDHRINKNKICKEKTAMVCHLAYPLAMILEDLWYLSVETSIPLLQLYMNCQMLDRCDDILHVFLPFQMTQTTENISLIVQKITVL